MSSVKSVYHNIEFMSDNNKNDMVLFGDSHFCQNKNTFFRSYCKSY